MVVDLARADVEFMLEFFGYVGDDTDGKHLAESAIGGNRSALSKYFE
jgi:hypothetical protein